MSAEQRKRHDENRRRLLAAGWRESERAGNRWWPPKMPPGLTLGGYADRYPCSTLDALNELAVERAIAAVRRKAAERRAITSDFERGELLVSAVRALPSSVFACDPWGAT